MIAEQPMTLEQLRIFVAVAECQHMTQAAAALNLTQPAVSAAVNALETRYGVQLFDRIGRRIELTSAGRDFLTEARALLARAASAQRTLSDLAGVKRGAIVLFASQTIANYWLPKIMARFHTLYPDVALRLTVGNTEQVAAAAREGRADLGFVEGAVSDADLWTRKLPGDRLVIVAPRDHPLVARPNVRAADIASAKWVLREPGSGTRTEFERALKTWNLTLADLDVALELPSNEAVCTAVEAGAGVTAISQYVAASRLAAGSLAISKFEFPRRSFLVLRNRERHIAQAEAAFLKLIEEPAPDGHKARAARTT
jgi:DNA-binding transcriptional LysR family regulator